MVWKTKTILTKFKKELERLGESKSLLSFLFSSSANLGISVDGQHAQFALMLDNRYGFAPLKAPQIAVDIATGTGMWAFQFGT